ncbi:GTP cyclohydrolase-2 [compost metagenome]
MVEYVLHYFGITKIRLLTNNPKKIESLSGVEIVERLPIVMEANEYNKNYLQTKKAKLGHLF